MVIRAGSMPGSRVEDAGFHTALAAGCVLVAFGSFAPTYWLQLPAGTFIGAPLVHLHGALFSLWPLFLLSQSWLAWQGRLRQHRAWGLAGIALASMMLVLGIAAAIGTLRFGLAKGYGDAARSFFIAPFTAMLLFTGFVTAAIVKRHDRGWHQRLMLLGTLSLLQAALARVFFLLRNGVGPGLRPGLGHPPPVLVTLPAGLLLQLFIVAGIVHDWRRHGRVHPAWWVGLVAINLVILGRIPFSNSQAWLDFAGFMAGFAG